MSNRLPLIASLSFVLTISYLGAQTGSSPVDGTTPPALASGQPAGSYPLSGFETVNLFNGSLNFHLPLASLQGRGGLSISSMLTLERHWIVIDDVNGRFPSTTEQQSSSEIRDGYGPGSLTAREMAVLPALCDGSNFAYHSTLSRLTFTGPDGSQMEFVDSLTGGHSSFLIRFLVPMGAQPLALQLLNREAGYG